MSIDLNLAADELVWRLVARGFDAERWGARAETSDMVGINVWSGDDLRFLLSVTIDSEGYVWEVQQHKNEMPARSSFDKVAEAVIVTLFDSALRAVAYGYNA